jgi:hypothetical protein
MAGSVEDSKEQLLAELKEVRRAGVGKLRPSRVPHLCRIASKVETNDLLDLAIRIERTLQLAINRMGDVYGGAASLLIGTAPAARGLGAEERRKKAAVPLGKTSEAFRKTDETPILEDLVVQLLALEVEEEAPSPSNDVDSSSQNLEVDSFSSLAAHGSAQALPEVEHSEDGELHPGIGTESPEAPGGQRGSNAGDHLGTSDSDASVPDRREKPASHRSTLLKPLIVVVLAMIVAISTLAATSTWPFGNGRVAQIPSPNASNGAVVGCVRSNSKVPAPSIPSGPNRVHVKLQVQSASAASWSEDLSNLHPGTIARFLLSYSNASSAVQNQVVLRANLAPGSLLVPDSTCLYDAGHPKGLDVQSNDVDQGGINIGNFGAGANAYLLFSVALPPSGDVLCGKTVITTVGVARPSGLNEFENSAIVNVEKSCSKVGQNGSSSSGTAQVSDSMSLKVGLPGTETSKLTSVARIPAGDPVAWAIIVVHESLSQLNSAVLLDQIPDGVMVVPGSVKLFNGNYPDGFTFPSTAVQDNGRQINVNLGDYGPLSTQAASTGEVSAEVTFETEFVAISPNNCTRRVITNNAWFGTIQYPLTMHAAAKAEVSC